MADFNIGLDFGTSQTKVCLYNKNSNLREFLKFENDSYFVPSLIVKNNDNTFSYGDETVNGTKYRYFKMSAAEDDDLIQVTNQDLQGNLDGSIEDFRKYSTDAAVKPEILVILYLSYVYLFLKKTKNTQNTQNIGGLLGRLATTNETVENTFAINLGIPTEWNNPNHIKRKIKFQSLLLTAIKLANTYQNLEQFLTSKDIDLFDRISQINESHLIELANKTEDASAEIIKNWLNNYNLSVFPESAAGINYLLKTNRLANGSYATLDIGAGTSDIAIFKVENNELSRYYCSESVEIASNDFYKEYAKQHFQKDFINFDEIRLVENIVRNDDDINEDSYRYALQEVKGFLNSKGVEFAIRKTFYRKYYICLYQNNQIEAINAKNNLNGKDIIVFGGGANLDGFCSGNYCFYQGNNSTTKL